MHQLVIKSVDIFLGKNDKLRKLFERLLKADKKMFLITNSPFKFVNNGMNFLVGHDWETFFDVVIVEARKPRFFTNESRPIRVYDKNTDTNLWDKVSALHKGRIYYQGTIKHLLEMTGWRGPEVLYFGDHPYTDLADVTLEYGWRTGAIINELTHEINNLNNPDFKRALNWLQMLGQLIEEREDSDDPDSEIILHRWRQECDRLRDFTKTSFNKQFGSVFRTHHTATYFSRRLFRFSDIYTSSITNLFNYSIKHTFYPRRGIMPHEYTSYFV